MSGACDDFNRKSVIRSFRYFLENQGFLGASIVRLEEDSARYCVSCFDPVTNRPFCRVYKLRELEAILEAQRIFWRYVK